MKNHNRTKHFARTNLLRLILFDFLSPFPDSTSLVVILGTIVGVVIAVIGIATGFAWRLHVRYFTYFLLMKR
jgi:hypothetical protein